MSDQTAPDSIKIEREAQIALADAENRIDGLFRDPRTDAIFEAYVTGEIPVTDIVARLHALLGS